MLKAFLTFHVSHIPISIFTRCTSTKQISLSTVTFLPWHQTCLHFSGYGNGNSTDGSNASKKNRGGRRNGPKVPRLLYIQHPLKYLKNRWDMFKLKVFWDFSFRRKDFLYGSRKALEVVTDYIRNQNAVDLNDVTTPGGFKQIARDMILSKADPRMHLMKFRVTDIQTAIPARIYLIKVAGRKYCLIDVFFVGMRNVTDFDSFEELKDISQRVKAYDKVSFNDKEFHSERIIFAEVYIRFYREFTKGAPIEWSVGLYKVANFDVI